MLSHADTTYWREEDLSCGPGTVAADGLTSPAECDPDEARGQYCCSDQGMCGSGPEFCECQDCRDYRTDGKKYFFDMFSRNMIDGNCLKP